MWVVSSDVGTLYVGTFDELDTSDVGTSHVGGTSDVGTFTLFK